MNDKLTVEGYINRPLMELAVHPDFNLTTFEAISKVTQIQPSCRDNFLQLVNALIENRKEK